MIEDLARAVFPARADTSRQPDPAEPTPSPEDGEADESGGAGVAATATPVPDPRDAPAPPATDLGVEPATRHVTTFLLALFHRHGMAPRWVEPEELMRVLPA
ncbi:hypothetical protein [Nocardioides sp. SR21]|uniref:hypothetical protein n=1 Tax=Nocardioides sp. SR21 TaxID=2919501 RepID=UPI001FAA4BC0|nr:hypothetical protein [Nocardioides sp. SR21]